MDMRLFLLKREGEEVPVKLKIKIISNLNSFSSADINFEEFTSLKSMFSELSGALATTEFIVIAVTSGIYNKTKLKLMTALSLETEENALVKNRMASLNLDEEDRSKNARMPVDAALFPSDDGVNSGFSVKKGKQNIAVIPVDEQRTDAVIKKGLVPYLTSGYVVPGQVEEKAEQQTVQQDEDSFEISESQKQLTLRTINILRESDVKIAVNGNNNSAVLRQFGEELDGFDDYFTFTPHIEDRGDYNVTDYTAQMARSAKGLSNADLGACISDIFQADEVDYICIAVATDKSALVRKLYKEDDESDSRFIAGAAEELLALICEKTSGNSSVGIEITQQDVPEKGKPQKNAAKIIIAVICVLAATAVCVGAVWFLKNRNRINDVTTQPQTEQTTQEETSETTTVPEEVTEPVSTVTPMKLSELIDYEFENGIQNTVNPDASNGEETTAPGAITDDETTAEPQETKVTAPKTIRVNGADIDAREAIARIVEAEMDSGYAPSALRAQAVIAYTYLKYRNTGWVVDNIILTDTYSQNVYDAVNEVFGNYLADEETDEPVFTPFHKMSAGYTASSEQIFGKAFSHLTSVKCSSDNKNLDGYSNKVIFSADDVKTALLEYDSEIKLDENPANWFEITDHDTTVSKSTGYVKTIKVGDKEMSGYTFVTKAVRPMGLASTCFSVTYNEEEQTFTFDTFGQGHGVGMSQTYAQRLASASTKYGKILQTFYRGTVIKSEPVEEE